MTSKIILLEEIILQVLCLSVPMKQKDEIEKIVKKLREMKREYIKKLFLNQKIKTLLKTHTTSLT